MKKNNALDINTPKLIYKLFQILSLEFSYNQPKKQHEQKPGTVNYDISPSVGFNVELNHVVVTLKVSAKIISTKEIFFKTTYLFIFELSNMKDIVELNDKGFVAAFKDKDLENYIFSTLIGISYSTLRGIIIEKGAGTILQFDFMPVIDPSVFVQNNKK